MQKFCNNPHLSILTSWDKRSSIRYDHRYDNGWLKLAIEALQPFNDQEKFHHGPLVVASFYHREFMRQRSI